VDLEVMALAATALVAVNQLQLRVVVQMEAQVLDREVIQVAEVHKEGPMEQEELRHRPLWRRKDRQLVQAPPNSQELQAMWEGLSICLPLL
jgi:hypothetical protein